MANLGVLGNGYESFANAVSADGQVVVGTSYSDFVPEVQAFRWTPAGGMVALGDLPAGASGSIAEGVSADGSVIAGSVSTARGVEAYRWTSQGGLGLGHLPGAGSKLESYTWGISPDGTAVVGQSWSGSGFQAFRWTEDAGMTGLGQLYPPFDSIAVDASEGGARVVGLSWRAAGTAEAFIWDPGNGMRHIASVLATEHGLGPQLAGWTLWSAEAISADGLTIVGSGRNPSGWFEGWVAQIPEPSAVWLLGAALAGLGWLRRGATRRGTID
jgi:probable HAF family extracellular repeat protein